MYSAHCKHRGSCEFRNGKPGAESVYQIASRAAGFVSNSGSTIDKVFSIGAHTFGATTAEVGSSRCQIPKEHFDGHDTTTQWSILLVAHRRIGWLVVDTRTANKTSASCPRASSIGAKTADKTSASCLVELLLSEPEPVRW